MENRAKKNETAGRLKRIDAMEAHWGEIIGLLEALPSSDEVIGLLQSLDSPYLPQDIGVDRALLRDTLLYCKEVRERYTLLSMLQDLALLQPLADQVIADVCPEG